ncbi:hypothetical protein KIN20_008080 [Parelaphostrongylus tenuis]|uniref:Protein kinase domain-containing protein n=1 Tax=Parelaphostrongylus tenuis TaxID=148309 RepID=A0AAD5MMA8_PARTN|nr:hypothetical protein KIN20_008080 [Parelaphostrongylus tenuis]
MTLTLEKAKAQKRYPNKTSHSNPVLATTAEENFKVEATLGDDESTKTLMICHEIHSTEMHYTEKLRLLIMVSAGDAWLQSKNFYHGYLPREDMPPLLLRNRDFVVRISEANIKGRKTKVRERASSRVISVLVNPQNNDELVPLIKKTSLVGIDTITFKWRVRRSTKSTVLRKGGKIVNVAIKTLTMTNMMTRELIREIMKEVRIMRCLHHTNVVGFVGVVFIDHPLYIALEYVPGKSIRLWPHTTRRHLGNEDGSENSYKVDGTGKHSDIYVYTED